MRILYQRTAQRDIDGIYAYIAKDNPDAAIRVVERIRAAIEVRADYPPIGRPGRKSGTRELVVAHFHYVVHYVVPYRVVGNEVRIVRVLHPRKSGLVNAPPLSVRSGRPDGTAGQVTS